MNKQEVNKLLALMRANYSYAFKSMSKEDRYLLLNTWTFTLQDLDANIVMLAAMKLISVSKWLPTVAEIREKYQSMYYEAAYIDDIARVHMPRTTLSAYEAVANKTQRLHGDAPPELSLAAMFSDPKIVALTTGQDRQTELLESNISDEWDEEGADER